MINIKSPTQRFFSHTPTRIRAQTAKGSEKRLSMRLDIASLKKKVEPTETATSAYIGDLKVKLKYLQEKRESAKKTAEASQETSPTNRPF